MENIKESAKNESQKLRVDYAAYCIENAGYDIFEQTNTEIRFIFKNEIVYLFPYTGWHTGKSIKDGRGIKKLLSQIK